ncbi:MAG TPA: exodeoxyribonuclease VII small subunit [Clostridia bacterium]|nr:exodeoxyribonuclease VII small subunit [Clostridia bacterium]
MKKEMTFESAISRLEKIVELLEQGDVTLDESMKLFEEGAHLSVLCSRKLTEAEQKIIKINDSEKENGEANDEQ